MRTFDTQTSIHIDPKTGRVTTGGAARNCHIAEAGGQDRVQQKAYELGYLDGHADGYSEGHADGAADAYNRVDARLKNIEAALLLNTK